MKPFRFLILSLVVTTSVACSSSQVRPYREGSVVNTNTDAPVQILYSYPSATHSKLGAISIRHYRPGFRDPTVEDARDKLIEAGQSLGATAVVIIDASVSGMDRTILIRAEAIKITGAETSN